MKHYPWSILVLVPLFVTQAEAGYRDLVRDLDSYQPPPVVSSQMEAKGTLPSKVTTAPDDGDFQAQRAELNRQQEQWRASLKEPPPDESFLLPDPALVAHLQETAQSVDAAGTALAGDFSLENLEVLVLLRSPAVQAKEREFEGTLAGYSQAEHLDTILRSYAALTKSVMTGVGGMTNPDPVALKFPFPGILALKGEIVGQEVRVAREGVEAARRDALTVARKAFAQLWYIHDALEITRSQLHLMTDQQQTVSTRYQAGGTEFDAVLKVGIELEQLKEELISLKEEQGNAEMAIRTILSLPERTRIGRPSYARGNPPRAVDLDALYSLALQRRQEIRAKQAMVGKSERMVELAETMIYPGFTANQSLSEADVVSVFDENSAIGAVDESPAAANLGPGVPLPKTPWFGADDAYLRQAREQIKALAKDVEAERAATLLGVREAWYRLDKARRQEALYRERITTLARAGFDTASQAYAAGRVSFAELIASANGWLAARLGLARAKADHIIAQAELDAAVGVSLGQDEAMDELTSKAAR